MTDTVTNAWELAVRDRLVARDPGALSDLYDQFGSYVFGLAVRVIGDRHAAEDVSQEVFLSLWERPEAFEPAAASARSWGRSLTAARSTSSGAKRPAGAEPLAKRRPRRRSPTSASSRWRS
jgi:RNA polymerase sigma-70 factor (ECF subfamily)